MRAHRSTLATGILATLIVSTGPAYGQDAQAQLVEQGKYWQARDNTQRAAEVWQKVLSLDANQINALYGMGVIAIKQNNPKQANDYLKRLQALSPQPWQASQLQQEIALSSTENQSLLAQARRYVDAGERDKATMTYRRLFNGLTPQGVIGREYYNNLAFSTADWPEARRGLERLLRETPDDSILALFYAQQLARHEDSRAEGARRLAKLTKQADIAGYAEESWRLALVWMGTPTAQQVPLFEEFLKAHPDDQEIRAQMNKVRQKTVVVPQDTVNSRGLRSLGKGDLASAESAFQERLKSHPGDRDALGGMGVIRQQQNRLVEAEQLLSSAVGKGGSQWKVALNSVRYWLLIERGRDLQAQGLTAQAKEAFTQAMRLDPQNMEGRVSIADAQASEGQFDTAMAGYRQVLKMQANNPSAVRGLANVLSQTGKADEALRLLDSLSPAEQAKFDGMGRFHAIRAMQQASLAEQRGDLAGAQNALREAIRNDPDNVWTIFSLARLYVKLGEPQKGRDAVDGFIRTHRDSVDALYVSALLSVEMTQWQEAQDTMNRIPLNRRTVQMNALADQITLTMNINHATALSKRGQRQEALALLDQLKPIASVRPESIGMLAEAYVDAGDTEQAFGLMQPLVASGRTPSTSQLLQYGGILLRTGDDAQVYAILSSIQSQSLGAQERKRFDDLSYQYRVHQADRLREGGDLMSAYDTLAPALMQRPGDQAAVSALARMYNAAGNNVKALELYKTLVKGNAQDTGLLLNAADAAVLAKDRAYADTLLGQFSRLDNNDPVLLTEAARIYKSLGKTKEATVLLRKAVALESRADQRNLASRPGNMDLSVNPFRNQSREVAGYAAPTLPPPAQTALYRGAAPVPNNLPVPASTTNRGQLQAPAPAYAAAPVAPAYMPPAYVPPAYMPAPVYSAASQPAGNVANASAAQRALFAQQVEPKQVLPVDNSSQAQRALNEILQAQSASITQGVIIRSNASEPGLSQIDDVQTPLEVNMPAGDGRLVGRVTPVSLSSGSMSDDAAVRFGGGDASAAGAGKQRANGVGLAVAYEMPDAGIKADIGTTPIGFKYTNVVGGVSVDQALENDSNTRYGLTLSRRAVTDSLTSFAGTTDRRDNVSWGGVTANGGRVELSHDDMETGVYTYGTLHRLLGKNVLANTRFELGGGAYTYLNNTENEKLTAGVSATVLRYANNQNFYTYGHGGYFSPQSYLSVGVPVTWAKRSDNLTLQVKGSVGVQYFRQDAANYFPTNDRAQGLSGKRYASQTKTGLGYSLEGAGEYRFAPKLFVGGSVRLNNSNDFREVNVGMYVRYTFENMVGKLMTLPLSPYRSPYSH